MTDNTKLLRLGFSQDQIDSMPSDEKTLAAMQYDYLANKDKIDRGIKLIKKVSKDYTKSDEEQ